MTSSPTCIRSAAVIQVSNDLPLKISSTAI